MLAVLLTLSFVVAGFAVIGVLASSYARGLAAFGELRRALAVCDDKVSVRVRIVDHTAVRLQLVSSARLSSLPQPALRAAA